MRRALQTTSWLALIGTILPSALYLLGLISLASCQWTMLAATAAWFAATPLWMGREPRRGQGESVATSQAG